MTTTQTQETTMKASDLVVVETIPESLRASHAAAGNSGVWPGNGAERVVMDRADAEDLVEHDPEWSEILESEDPADYANDESTTIRDEQIDDLELTIEQQQRAIEWLEEKTGLLRRCIEEGHDMHDGLIAPRICHRCGYIPSVTNRDDAQAQAQTTLEEQWWGWHDKDYSRWDYETVQEAEIACAAWVRGESDVGPDRNRDSAIIDEGATAQTSYQAIEDNGGGLHLAVFDESDNCTHFMSNFELHDGSLSECIRALSDGENPNSWDGLSVDPQGEYDAITAVPHGWKIVADDNFIYRDRMGSAARREFGIDEQ
jgi:hypothetical protein